MTKKKEPYRPKPLTDSKRKFISKFITEFNLHSTEDIQNALRDLLGDTIKSMMEAEMTDHLGYEKSERSDSDNSRNGTKPKKVRSKFGELSLDVPKDRNGTFEPQIVKNRQKDISEIDEKIINMYGRGLSTRQISDQMKEIYGFECSESFIANVTDKIMGELEDWKVRPLNSAYPILYIDAVHFSVREEGVVQKLAAYVILGVNLEGKKEVLSIEIGASESAKFWLGALNALINRGVEDVMVICADGLSGIKEAISAVFPKAEYQRCIVHMVRNTLRYVPHKDRKSFANDLREIYLAVSEEAGRQSLDRVSEKWKAKYPSAMKRWHDNWDVICPIFKFSMVTRKVIYTTNAIESLNSTYKRLNRQRSVFPSSKALLKTLYLSTKRITQKWKMPLKNWSQVYNEFVIMYGDRMLVNED